MNTTIYEIQARDTSTTAGWSAGACGDEGPELTRFSSRAEAEAAIDGLRAPDVFGADADLRVVELEIDVHLDGAVGPRVVAPWGLDQSEIEAAVPAGWRPVWGLETEVSAPRCPRRVSYPLEAS